MSSAVYTLVLAAAFALLFGLAEMLHHMMLVPAETTRKIVHAGTGLLTMLFPLLLHDPGMVGLLCGSFLIILALSMRYGMLPSIHAIRRKSWGSLLYPVIVFAVFVFYERYTGARPTVFHALFYFYTPILIMAICDPLAASVGGAWHRRHPELPPGKTMAGSFAFFCGAALLTGCLAGALNQRGIHTPGIVLVCIMTAFATTLAERFSSFGSDNFTVPVAAMLVIHLMETGLQSFPGR